MKARHLALALLSSAPVAGFCQLVLDSTQTPQQLVQNVLLGSGVAVSNVEFNYAPGTTISVQAMEFDGIGSNVGMTSGILLCSGDAHMAIGPNNNSSQTLPPAGLGLGGDPDLTQLLNTGGGAYTTNDAAVLEFDFVPNGDTLRFKYVFGSEEYLEWVGSSFNDVFGFFLSGPGFAGPYSGGAENIAIVPGTISTPVTIDNVNDVTNSTYYVDNGDGFSPPQNTDSTVLQFDGFTTVLTAEAIVQCGQTYHIKMAVADAGDHVLDSGVFLEAGSFTSTAAVTASLATTVGLIDSTLYEGCATAILSFERYGDFSIQDTVQLVVAGTATNGVDYSPTLPSALIFMPGDSIISFALSAPVDADLFETVDLTMLNVAACSGMLVVTNFTFYINEAQPMYLTVSDTAIGCDDFVTIGPNVFEGYGNYGYTWSNGATTPTITVSPPVTTTYTVTVTDTCGIVPQTANITVTVPVYPPVTIIVSNDTAIACLQNATLQVQASGGDGVYTYDWTDAGGTTLSTLPTLNIVAGPLATYYIYVEAGCGLGATDSVVVSPLPLPPIVVSTNNDTTVLCPGDPVDLIVVSASGGNGVYTYLWTDQGGATTGTTTSVNVNVNDTALYVIQVDDQCGNTGFDSIMVYTPQYDPFQIYVANDTAICLGENVDLWVYAIGGAGNYTYDWSNPHSTDISVSLTPDTTDTYPVSVTDQCGSTLSDAVIVDVQSVEAGFIINYTDEYDVTFFNTSSYNCTEYLWEFGDGDEAETQHTGHHYIDTDDHIVWLTVWNPLGCVDSTSVLVQPPAHLYLPNAFTPDGDGVNDVFGPVGHDLSEFEMRIFDRWGEVIYSTSSPDKPWDGKVNGAGEIAQNGVYVWKLKATGRRFGPVEYVGSVALVK